MKKILCAALCIASICNALIFAAGKKDMSAGDKIRITLIPMKATDERWRKIRAGAEAKAAELGNVELTCNAPADKAEASAQVLLVEAAITKKANVIILAPLNKDALAPGVEKAKAAGIKVIIIDSSVSTKQYDAFIESDNKQAGSTAANALAALISEKGKIAIINSQSGDAAKTTLANEFKNRIRAKYPDIKLVGVQYSNGDKDKAKTQALDVMSAEPDLAGFYGCDEASTIGIAQAVTLKKMNGKIMIVGVGLSNATRSLIQKKTVQAVMEQNSYRMGTDSIDAGVRAFKGEDLGGKTIDIGVLIVNGDTLGEIR